MNPALTDFKELINTICYKRNSVTANIENKEKEVEGTTLKSKATDTSKTFIMLKVFTFENLDWFCLKAHYLPFIHAKVHSSSSIINDDSGVPCRKVYLIMSHI